MAEVIIKQSLTAPQLTNGSIISLQYTRIAKVFCFMYGIVIINTVLNIVNPYGVYNDDDNPGYNGIIVATLLPFFFFFAIRQQSIKALKTKERYYRNISFTLTQDHVKSEGEGYNNTYKWEEIVKVKETRNWYLIFINKHQSLIIHKSNIDLKQQEMLNNILVSIRTRTKVLLK